MENYLVIPKPNSLPFPASQPACFRRPPPPVRCPSPLHLPPSSALPLSHEKQREFYKNAKLVNKYKKAVKQHNISSQHMPTTLDDKEDQPENPQMQSKTKKKIFRSLKEEYEKKHAEDEKARIEREAIIQAKNEERAKNEAKRKTQREKMFKKTRFGQPVMKYRIEHILEGLLESSKKQT